MLLLLPPFDDSGRILKHQVGDNGASSRDASGCCRGHGDSVY